MIKRSIHYIQCILRYGGDSMPMLRVSDETYEKLVKFRGELERSTGKPRSLGQTLSLMVEASILSFGVADIELPTVKISQIRRKSQESFREYVNFAGTMSLRSAFDAVCKSEDGALK